MKYKNLARAEQNDKELEELEKAYVAANTPDSGAHTNDGSTPEPNTQVVEVPTPDEGNWKQRYGDLKSYVDKTLKREISELKVQLEKKDKEVQTSQIPQNVEEAREWVMKYPSLASVLKTLWKEDIEQMVEDLGPRLQKLEEREEKITLAEAKREVLEAHPDFDKLLNDPNFIEWVQRQPDEKGRIGEAIFDSLNSLDVQGAIRAVNIYKQELDTKNKPTRTRAATREAAETVGRTSGVRLPEETNGKPTFSESQVDRMSIRDYEKFEDAIDEAKREGRFIYDLSGAAR